MTTREELQALAKQRREIIKDLDLISLNLEEGELTLQDIIAEEERLKERADDLIELMQKTIRTRQWLDFEESDPRNALF